MRSAPWPGTVPNRSCPSVSQSSRARATSSWVRPTKFHHMTRSSAYGSPPSSSSRAPSRRRQPDRGRGRSAGAAAARRPGPPASRSTRSSPSPSGRGPALEHEQPVLVTTASSASSTEAPGLEHEVGARAAGCGPGRARPPRPATPTNTVARSPGASCDGQLAVLLEPGALVVARGQGHPQLDRVQQGPLAQRQLGVRDARAGGHEVELAGAQHDVAAEAVAVVHLARERPRHRLQPGVRVRQDPHVHALGADPVEEAPGPDGGQGPVRQPALHAHPADAAEGHLAAGQQGRCGSSGLLRGGRDASGQGAGASTHSTSHGSVLEALRQVCGSRPGKVSASPVPSATDELGEGDDEAAGDDEDELHRAVQGVQVLAAVPAGEDVAADDLHVALGPGRQQRLLDLGAAEVDGAALAVADDRGASAARTARPPAARPRRTRPRARRPTARPGRARAG